LATVFFWQEAMMAGRPRAMRGRVIALNFIADL
jgi:hypothetical protein